MLAAVSVSEIMVSDVATTTPDASIGSAAGDMADRDVGSLVVEADESVGILTQSDVVDFVASDGVAGGTTVSEWMSSPAITIDPDASVEDAATVLAREGIKRLPVVDDGDLVGIVTVTDLSYFLPQIALGRRGSRRGPASRPEMAYDDEDWHADLQAGEEPEVGDRVRFTKRLTEQDVTEFAHASGDTNRLHLDAGFAAGTRFGERIVHGTLLAGVVSAALARLPGLTIYLSQDLTFSGPVPIGGIVTAVCEITEALGGNRFRVATSVYHEDEPVIDGQATVLIDQLHEAVPLERAAVESGD